MKLGRFQIHLVHDGTFRLDGGAMFGVVPKTLWSRVKPADERNRILMASNSLLIDDGDQLTLVDTGIGDKNDAKFRDIFGLEDGATRLPQALHELGVEPERIDHVVLTHLHFDHCGWNSCERAGRLVPTFPNAKYWLQRDEVEHARAPLDRDAASYDPRNWEPLFEAGVVEQFDDEAEPMPGVRLHKAPGHNGSMCIVRIDGGGTDQAIFFADLVPTAAHVPYAWIMGFDLYPVQTLENKKKWIPAAAEGNWLCFFQHDPELSAGFLYESKPGRYAVRPLSDTDSTD